MNKKGTTVYLSEKAKRLLALLANDLGISRSAVLELLIREKAENSGIKD